MQENNLNEFTLTEISFNDIPKAMAYLIGKVEKLESLISNNQSGSNESDQWFNLQQLQEYHPDHPAAPTVYAWVGQRLIPNHKHGKKLMFLKSEIDEWLKSGKRKTAAELRAEAAEFVAKKGRIVR
ncbi:MAG TPA: helix-turn-helix domain-containing protein [Paludibacter sp.]|jgi:hypothetical protein